VPHHKKPHNSRTLIGKNLREPSSLLPRPLQALEPTVPPPPSPVPRKWTTTNGPASTRWPPAAPPSCTAAAVRGLHPPPRPHRTKKNIASDLRILCKPIEVRLC